MNLESRNKPVVDILFLLALFCVFLISALFIVLFGARIYRSTVDSMDQSFKSRTAVSYITEKVRQHDHVGAASIINVDDYVGESPVDTSASGKITSGTVLVLTEEVNGEKYNTYLYEREGQLMELTSKEGVIFRPQGGQPIVAVHGFTTSEVNDALYRFTITTEEDEEFTYYISLYSHTNEEEALLDE